MFSLKSRQDLFKVTLPEEFIPSEIDKKYSKLLNEANSFIHKPIDFLNETIQGMEILGFTQAAAIQQQHGVGDWASNKTTIQNNRFLHASSDVAYRAEMNPLNLIDKTLRLTFRHTLGFVNYFMLLDSFWVMYRRDTHYDQLPQFISVDILNSIGVKISRILIHHPIIDGIDMLSLNYTQPIAQSQTFNCEIKYSNIEFEFINNTFNNGVEFYDSEIRRPLNDNSY
jgi:hypothetical protein